MLSIFLQRILPFALSLFVGVVFGGITNPFRTQTAQKTFSVTQEYRYQGRRSGCGSRRMAFLKAGGVGSLVSIQRQTEDGNWVSVRPVGPEIYRETTRPAIIRSRPFASYTDEAREHSVVGNVLLEAVLSPTGEVTDIKPQWKLPDGLTVQAVQAAQQLDFEPALKAGRPVEQRILLQFEFGL